MKDFLTALLLACGAVCIGLSTHVPTATAATSPAAAGWASDRPAEAPAPLLDEAPQPAQRPSSGPIDINID